MVKIPIQRKSGQKKRKQRERERERERERGTDQQRTDEPTDRKTTALTGASWRAVCQVAAAGDTTISWVYFVVQLGALDDQLRPGICRCLILKKNKRGAFCFCTSRRPTKLKKMRRVPEKNQRDFLFLISHPLTRPLAATERKSINREIPRAQSGRQRQYII